VKAVTRNQCDGEPLFGVGIEQQARALLPPDARRIAAYSTPDGWPGATFRSAQLAALFPAAAFEDCASGKTLPPGTVSFARSPGGTVWLIAIGQCL
jgi:hypothetical protein